MGLNIIIIRTKINVINVVIVLVRSAVIIMVISSKLCKFKTVTYRVDLLSLMDKVSSVVVTAVVSATVHTLYSSLKSYSQNCNAQGILTCTYTSEELHFTHCKLKLTCTATKLVH